MFNQNSIQFYGHTLSAKGLAPDRSKIEAILKMQPPRNASEVRSLLGMTNYCGSRFIKDYATITHPLRVLTKKDVAWEWSSQHQTAFKTLKKQLTQTPTLQYYDPELPTEIHVDASPVGLSAILMQTTPDGMKHTVQYASRALTAVEQRYSQTEREGLAVVWACEHLHMYIWGASFVIYSDHKPLIPLYNNPRSKPPARIERWSLRLQPYDVEVRYRPGHDNPADYLSRHVPNETATSDRERSIAEEYINFVLQSATPKAMSSQEIRVATESDATLKAVTLALASGNWTRAQNQFINTAKFDAYKRVKEEISCTESGILLRGSRIIIPEALTQRAVDLAHAGHQGIVKTKALIREKIWFPGIDSMVEKTIRSCNACQANTPSLDREPLKMSTLPSKPWSEISTDFGQVPGTLSYFMVISDDFSRYPVVETVDNLTARAVLPVLDKVLGEFGIPDVIKSDNGPPFNSRAFSDFATAKGFKHRKITPLWPRANAEAERFMKTVKKTMKASITQGKSWKQDLHAFLLNYRATPHCSTGIPPATIMFGRDIHTTLPQHDPDVNYDNVRSKDQHSKMKMKEYADKKAYVRDSNLKVGDLVLVKQEGMGKSKPLYDPKPMVITDKKGTMVTAERGGRKTTRNSSFFKPSGTVPDDQDSSDEDPEPLTPLMPAVPEPEPVAEIPTTPPHGQTHDGSPRKLPRRERRLPAKFKDYEM